MSRGGSSLLNSSRPVDSTAKNKYMPTCGSVFAIRNSSTIRAFLPSSSRNRIIGTTGSSGRTIAFQMVDPATANSVSHPLQRQTPNWYPTFRSHTGQTAIASIYNESRIRAVDVSPRRKRTPGRSSPGRKGRVPLRCVFGGLEPVVLLEADDAPPHQSSGKLQLTAESPRQGHENDLTRLIPLPQDDANRLNPHRMPQKGK